jgi:hypothetical protein
MKTLRLHLTKTEPDEERTIILYSSDVQSMQKCLTSKLYLRETTLFLQGCTIFTSLV